MVIDLQRCVGCGSCSISCRNENNVSEGIYWSHKITETSGTFPNVRFHYIPTLCNHCTNPPCCRAHFRNGRAIVAQVKCTLELEHDGETISAGGSIDAARDSSDSGLMIEHTFAMVDAWRRWTSAQIEPVPR